MNKKYKVRPKNTTEFGKSCAYIFYRWYSEEGIVETKFHLGNKERHNRINRVKKYKFLKKYNLWKKFKQIVQQN